MGGGRTSMGFDMDNAVEHYQALNPQTSEMWEQNRKIDHQTFKMLPPWRDHWKGLLEIAFPYHAMRARAGSLDTWLSHRWETTPVADRSVPSLAQKTCVNGSAYGSCIAT